MGRVLLHKELKPSDSDEKINGGGWWYYDMDNEILYLYGKSIDFGRIDPTSLDDVFVRPSLEGKEIRFSVCEDLESAMEDYIVIRDADGNV